MNPHPTFPTLPIKKGEISVLSTRPTVGVILSRPAPPLALLLSSVEVKR